MTTSIDLDTVRDTLVAQRKRRATDSVARTSDSLTVWPAAGPQDGVIDVLWSQRRVEDFGAVSRIEVPLAGDLTALPSCRALAYELERRWVHRRSLGGGLAPTSVAVELVRTVGGARLVMLVAAPGLSVQHPPTSVAMSRDLRGAIRRCGNQPLRTTPEMRLLLTDADAPSADR